MRQGVLRWLAAVALCGLLGLPTVGARAEDDAQVAALSAQDIDDLARVERYLTEIRTLEARFVQVSSNGTIAEGDLYLNRPGRLRFEYDPPFPVLMLADGLVLLYYDKELEEATYLPLWETPLWFLLKDEIKLQGSVRLLGIERGLGTLRLTVEEDSDDAQGRVTLVFSDQPLALKKWIVTDAQGITTEVALISLRAGVELDEALFDRRKILGGKLFPHNR